MRDFVSSSVSFEGGGGEAAVAKNSAPCDVSSYTAYGHSAGVPMRFVFTPCSTTRA